MDFVNRDDYCLTLDLHKSMFFIDMLKDTYEFTLKGDEVEIFKKIKNGISEPITRKELIYSIQVEMVEEYKYSSIKKKQIHSNLSKEEKHLRAFYIHFDTVDSIHKAIDNMVYLEKYLNKKEESEEESSDEEEKVSEEEHKMECMRLLRKQINQTARGDQGENKKLVLKNALEKECLSARTELFRPAWTPPR